MSTSTAARSASTAGRGTRTVAADGVANQEIARRCRDLIELYDREVTILERLINQRLRADKGYEAIHGPGSVLGRRRRRLGGWPSLRRPRPHDQRSAQPSLLPLRGGGDPLLVRL